MTTTLADHLRALPDRALAALLSLRTDLIAPVPADISVLASRAQGRVSVARALDPLDRFTLEILDALRYCREDDEVVPAEAVLALTQAARPAPAPALVRAALDKLRALFLVYGPDDALHLAAGIDEVCPPYPAGLGRPADELDVDAAKLCADPAGLRRAVLAAPPAARAVLERLAEGPPVGVATATALADPQSPVGWLVDRHLLASREAAGSDGSIEVELPREVALLLRRDIGPLGALHPQPPQVAAPTRDPGTVDTAGAGQAMELVRQAETLLAELAAEPAPVLKSGGLGVRDLRRLAKAAAVDEALAGLLLELAAAAGLLGEAEPVSSRDAMDARFLPTPAFDAWRDLPVATRWAQLTQAWVMLPRQPGFIGRRDERDRLVNALSAELNRQSAPRLRLAALGVLADAEPGVAPDASAVLDALAWRSPRLYGPRPPAAGALLAGGDAQRSEAVEWALREAAQLGITGLGALTGYGRLLLDEVRAAAGRDPDQDPLGIREGERVRTEPGAPVSEAVRALAALLPDPVDHMLVQADLTVVVPGPAEPGLAAELALVAEPESAGGATVHRITEGSLRRALDAGYPPADLHALFARRSRTPVPQGLTYLIDDVARRHGGLRVGATGAYLRSDDEALLTQLVNDRRLAALTLRRLAPTVLISPVSANRLVAALREAGYAPVPEDSSGATVVARPTAARAPLRTGVTGAAVAYPQPRPTPARLAGIVEQLRRGEAAARAARRAPVTLRETPSGVTAAQAHTQALATLQQALRARQRVWVGYVDAHGATASRLVRPVSMAAGYLRAEDDRTETVHTFALHRITAAVLEE
jgi:Helicase conserved C-terminal domain